MTGRGVRLARPATLVDGDVGMWGVSWGGFNAIQLAARGRPALKAILAIHATEDLFQDDIHYIDGLFHVDEYELRMDLPNAMTRAPDYPLDEASLAARFDSRAVVAPLQATSARRAVLAPRSLPRTTSAIAGSRVRSAAGSTVTGTAIPACCSTLQAPVKRMVGPWNHDSPRLARPGPAIDWRAKPLRWWDRWLKGERTASRRSRRWPSTCAAGTRRTRVERVPGEWRSRTAGRRPAPMHDAAPARGPVARGRTSAAERAPPALRSVGGRGRGILVG